MLTLNKPIRESGSLKSGQDIGYSFNGSSGGQLKYGISGVCVWVYTPNNEILTGPDLPIVGKYVVQISALNQEQNTTKFDLDLSLVYPKASIETNRVRFARGASQVTIEGEVKLWLQKDYLLRCAAGQQMTVRVTKGNINIEIFDKRKRQIGEIKSGAKEWRGRLPTKGDYTISVSSDKITVYQIIVEVI